MIIYINYFSNRKIKKLFISIAFFLLYDKINIESREKKVISNFKLKKKQKNKKKKGFTLVELLAVIVILAVVMVITIPTVLGSIGGAKSSALESSAKAIKQY